MRTQQQSDRTYAAYLKAAAALEKQFAKYPARPELATAKAFVASK